MATRAGLAHVQELGNCSLSSLKAHVRRAQTPGPGPPLTQAAPDSTSGPGPSAQGLPSLLFMAAGQPEQRRPDSLRPGTPSGSGSPSPYLTGETKGRQSSSRTPISAYRNVATAVHWKVIVSPPGQRRPLPSGPANASAPEGGACSAAARPLRAPRLQRARPAPPRGPRGRPGAECGAARGRMTLRRARGAASKERPLPLPSAAGCREAVPAEQPASSCPPPAGLRAQPAASGKSHQDFVCDDSPRFSRLGIGKELSPLGWDQACAQEGSSWPGVANLVMVKITFWD